MSKPSLWVWAFDTHWPKTDRATKRALLNFLEENKVAGFGFGGDQFDNESVSPHVRGKYRKVSTAALKRDEVTFDEEVLKPIEQRLPRNAEKVWIEGNHCDWINQYIDEHPELEGKLERPITLNLEKRGWQVVPCGKSYKTGKLRIIHGEAISGGGANCAKNALQQYCGSVLFGHFHSLQMATKVMPHDNKQKWAAYCSPILGSVNASYLRNKPTSWVNGWTIAEFQDNGNFNVVPLVVINGTFSYGGRLYRG